MPLTAVLAVDLLIEDHGLAFRDPQLLPLGLAQSDRIRQVGSEHGLRIRGRSPITFSLQEWTQKIAYVFAISRQDLLDVSAKLNVFRISRMPMKIWRLSFCIQLSRQNRSFLFLFLFLFYKLMDR
jgi:hypothetical protein